MHSFLYEYISIYIYAETDIYLYAETGRDGEIERDCIYICRDRDVYVYVETERERYIYICETVRKRQTDNYVFIYM